MTNEEFMSYVRYTTPTQASPIVAALGLCSESGEVADHVNKAELTGNPLDSDGVISDLGDVLWYVAYFADILGVTLEEIMSHNVAKLRKRYSLDQE